MEIVIGIALVLGIIWGVSRAIAGAEVSRLRNALHLATKQAANSGAEADMLRRTLDTYESALRARDHHIDTLLARVADQAEKPAGNQFRLDQTTPACIAVGDVLPEPVREALFGSRVVPAMAITGDDDGAFLVPAGPDGVLGADADDAVVFIDPVEVEVDMTITITPEQTADQVRDRIVAELTGADADGWIIHDGGEMPVPGNTIVEVVLRGEYPEHRVADTAAFWKHCWSSATTVTRNDIVRYRVVPA